MLRNAGQGPQIPRSIHRPQIPLANGQSKPLTVELLDTLLNDGDDLGDTREVALSMAETSRPRVAGAARAWAAR